MYILDKSQRRAQKIYLGPDSCKRDHAYMIPQTIIQVRSVEKIFRKDSCHARVPTYRQRELRKNNLWELVEMHASPHLIKVEIRELH